jgi:hypothetical protein
MKLDKNKVIKHVCNSCEEVVELVYPKMYIDSTVRYLCKTCFDALNDTNKCQVCASIKDNVALCYDPRRNGNCCNNKLIMVCDDCYDKLSEERIL